MFPHPHLLGARGGPLVSFAFNPADKGPGITLSGGNKVATLTGVDTGVRATQGGLAGTATFTFGSSSPNLVGVGLTTLSAPLPSGFLWENPHLQFRGTGSTIYKDGSNVFSLGNAVEGGAVVSLEWTLGGACAVKLNGSLIYTASLTAGTTWYPVVSMHSGGASVTIA